MSLPSLARRALDRANASPLWRCRPSVWGHPLVVPTADRLLYAVLHRFGLMGGAERRFFQAHVHPGMRVLDVGANVGLYTLLFSRLVGPTGRAEAFEPDAALFAALAASCRLNGADNVRAHPTALGARAGAGVLQKAWFNSGDNRVRAGENSNGAGPSGAPAVAIARADDALGEGEPVDFVKMDVQGFELQVLRGMTQVLDRNPTVQLHVEFWPAGLRAAGDRPAELPEFLLARGFQVQAERAGVWGPVLDWPAFADTLRGNHFSNLWAHRPGQPRGGAPDAGPTAP